ncbi:MAG: hypothetical protein NT139_00605 [Candidatus Woesearchaeota archaeon]|nr:hypothetical protein [Candidatus Woesearchaeota archaeon]
MQDLGIHAEPLGHNTLFSQQFLLNESELEQLSNALLETPTKLHKEAGDSDIPVKLLPENLPIDVMKDINLGVLQSISRKQANEWEVNYKIEKKKKVPPSTRDFEYSPGDLVMYPTFLFHLDKFDGKGFFYVTPHIKLNWRPKDDEGKDRVFIPYSYKGQFIAISREYFGDGRREKYLANPSRVEWDGINIVPVSSIPQFLADLEHLTDNLMLSELKTLDGLVEMKREVGNMQAYNEQRRYARSLAEESLLDLYHNGIRKIVGRIEELRFKKEIQEMNYKQTHTTP